MIKIIISPAKKMKQDTDTLECRGMPVFLQEAEYLKEFMKKLEYQQAKELWNCNDRIAALNYERFARMDLSRHLTPALLSYEGIQYQYMAPAVFEDQSWEYVENHLCILSGFYGLLKPFDGIVPYRLEMQAPVRLEHYRNLYDHWGAKIYREIRREGEVILNLASKEYSKCITPYLSQEDKFLTCRFGEWKEGKVVEKGTQVKMARGEMVRFLAQNKVEHTEQIREFQGLGYRYEESLSEEHTYVFIKR